MLVGLLLLSLSGCVKVLFVGDSLTMQYGPYARPVAEGARARARWVAWPGTNPCEHPWAQWITDHPWDRIDYVVIEDVYFPGIDTFTCPSEAAYRGGWTRAVLAAKAKGATVIELASPHPDLSGVEGIDVHRAHMMPADDPDGVHYLQAGALREAVDAMNIVTLHEAA
jgi:hypothetical protein